ncbi:PEP/pyruvate-binding domain-containing protein [Desulfurivibrio alkaliphilus]|uniref:Pyruvate phosphate dikinase PEP/pyruvate-binding protein n=1 Tax=Desulfurivibrio alkaliphilus (strain DSM 19089 / UNIQEM U267 / AHT2) TaxID=589865 RepID=D6Z5V6_DESAT|nr:PEP/pyruvate-binding domain-containing protein [Desulfurivibrio alkaliphilus]ADH84838.1 pyruvate phosphate dikinase PEP/pyruvate-binding protein [Desulfurivibrio alkaliphilus AHT 2]
MSYNYSHLSTGIRGLDRVIKGVMPGDNIVWQVREIDDYRYFVQRYAKFADLKNQRLVYFRYASHPPLLDPEEFPAAEIHHPDPEEGFEPFITQIHETIKQHGRGGYYVFDSLSDLANAWYSDRMLGNFFMLTCPYLLDMEALAFFALLRDQHSYSALTPVHETAQVIFDIYKSRDNIYVHPLKAQQRYSATMYMLHAMRENEFVPVTNSALNSEILAFTPFHSTDHAFEERDRWNRYFQEAALAVQQSREVEIDPETRQRHLRRLLEMVVTRSERMQELAARYLEIENLLEIGKRMIGTGLIGGKATGMLLSRAILQKDAPELRDVVEVHDSFYVGSDVFYTYMVINGCWWIRRQQKDTETLLGVAEYARRVILTGHFPEDIVRKLSDMLDYFGQSPIIVRSSSLLEDNYGNAFSGKYESVFCPNQGSSQRRLENLLTAIKLVYASTLSEKALHYREQMGILDKDEQMSLLIQRVSGDLHGNYFFPAVGGVGYSYNPYAWHPEIKPESGLIRIVYGMGTRAVDRADDDYTRIAALSAPDKRPESSIDELRKFAQKRVDAIDLTANRLLPVDFDEIAKYSPPQELRLAASQDPQTNAPYISFNGLFKNTPFVAHMQKLLGTLDSAYQYPVDIEFTLNFTGEEGCRSLAASQDSRGEEVMACDPAANYRINLVQCRPFEVRKSEEVSLDFAEDKDKQVLLAARQGTVIGRSRALNPRRLVLVSPDHYGALPVSQKHLAARAIGKIMKVTPEELPAVLVGPGRWGTTTVSLGIPVTFSEICQAACVIEVVAMHEGLIPDVSLGTHFFNDLVEFDIMYLAFYPGKEGSELNRELLAGFRNRYLDLVPEPEYRALAEIITVVDFSRDELVLAADIVGQSYQLYRVPAGKEDFDNVP